MLIVLGGVVIDDRAEAVASMSGRPWESFVLTDERVVAIAETCVAVAYKAIARRDEQDYTALFTSIYVRAGDEWKLAVHQQTPV